MSKVNTKDCNLLCSYYESFCNSAQYRSNEDFYSDDNNGIVELSYNENPLGAGELAQMAISHHVKYAHLYPPIDYRVLLEKIAVKQELSVDNIFISAGAVSVIYHAIAQFANDGDNVIFSKSSMPWYNWSVVANNNISIQVPLLEDMNHDLEGIIRAVNDKTKVIILSNPHNPTGLYIDEGVLLNFYKRLPKHVLLIIDQAYYEYQSNQEEILKKMLPSSQNLLLVRTFSKIHGLAGLRIGYGMGAPEIVRALKAKWLGTMPTVSSISTFAAYHALDDIVHKERSYTFNLKAKAVVMRVADEFNVKYLNSEANFITIKVDDSLVRSQLFRNEGIRLTTGAFFGYNEWLRMSFNKDLTELENKLRTIFKRINCNENLF